MVKNDDKLQKIFYVLFAIFLFHSTWWFFFSTHRARHYIISILVVIFALVLPILSSRPWTWRGVFFFGILLCSALIWKQGRVPFDQLNGHYFVPTEKTKGLIDVSGMILEQVGDELVITQNEFTFYDIRYLTNEKLRAAYFYADKHIYVIRVRFQQ